MGKQSSHETIMCHYRQPDGARRRKRRTLGTRWTVVEVLTRNAVTAMCGKLWSGWHAWEVTTVRGRQRLWPADWSYEELKVPKRKGRRGNAAAQVAEASTDSKLLGSCPHIIEHMASRVWDDGEPRTPGLIMLMTQGSVWRAVAKEPDERMQLVCYMPSLDDLLIQLELLLGSDEAPWEPDTWAKGKTAKKGPKN